LIIDVHHESLPARFAEGIASRIPCKSSAGIVPEGDLFLPVYGKNTHMVKIVKEILVEVFFGNGLSILEVFNARKTP
jgi:hypothetical protein